MNYPERTAKFWASQYILLLSNTYITLHISFPLWISNRALHLTISGDCPHNWIYCSYTLKPSQYTHTHTNAIHETDFITQKMACKQKQVYVTDLVDKMVTPTPQVAGWKQQQHVGVTSSWCSVYRTPFSLCRIQRGKFCTLDPGFSHVKNSR